MTNPVPVDLSTYPRREHFAHYRDVVPCTYSMTVEIDVTRFVTAIKATSRRSYISQIWALASIVNTHDEFRMTVTDSGALAVWPSLDPSFTIFHPAQETFSSVWVPFDEDFGAFHEAAARTIEDYADATALFPQGPPPGNMFNVSSLPWTSFTGFTLHIDEGSKHLAPIFTLGRYVERDGRTLLPLTAQVHHAVADGFHTSRLLNELQEMFAEPSWLGD